jgi:DNA polymerase-1
MEEGRRIRKAFVAPREDWMIVSADYSQIDLRSLAHISEDEILIDTFRQGIDIHTRTIG